jgi:serine/threonine protein kinase
MNVLCGFSDSLAGVVENLEACASCGGTSRLGNGSCLSCLLKVGADNGTDAVIEAAELERLLQEIEVPDQKWRLGNYEILEEIGRGGMGVIYRARQRHSRRIVAIKRVLSYHADSRETLERFRREAEAAASLDHPNILPIYEVSEGEDGLPFFSMKFAPGRSLAEVARALRNDLRTSVVLMEKVARAVAYAHEHGILHRDLKPGNILLDARGEPLVSDFGLAKWLDTMSDLTRTLTIFGTPGYIAPEQASSSAAKLSPAADVYSLGAILFDLIAGRPPFLGSHALSVIKQASEKPAPKLRSLSKLADRDLETICGRCLERDPRARYHSAKELAQDLDRWLAGRPISARRVLPSTRLWRWSRRNPKIVATAATCLLLGALSIWVLNQPAKVRSRSIATTTSLLSPQQAAEREKLRQVLIQYPDAEEDAQLSHLGWVNSGEASKQERLYSNLAARVGLNAKSLREKLPTFVEAVRRDPDAPIDERARAAYITKDYPEAERLSLRAAAEAQKKGEATHVAEIIDALTLAAASACKSSDDCPRAMEHLREAEKLTNRERDATKWADLQYAIANVFSALYQRPEAEKAFEDVLEVRTHIFGPDHPQTVRARRARACLLLQLEKDTEAEAEYRELLKIDEKRFGPEHPETLWSRWDVAEAISGDYAGKLEEALAEFRELLKLREKVLGPEHPDTLRTRGAVANTLSSLGNYTEAIVQKRELLKLQEKVLGPEDNYTASTVANLGKDLANVGALEEAEAVLRKAVALRQKIGGPDDFGTLQTRENLARTLSLEGRYSDAEKEVREIINIKNASVGVERSGWTRDLLGNILQQQSRYGEAETQFRQALRMNEKSLGSETSAALISRGNLARNLLYQQRNVEAEAQLIQLVALNEKALGAKTYIRINNTSSPLREEITPLLARTLLANALRDQRKYTEAEDEYKRCIQLFENELGRENRDTIDAYYQYAYLLAQQGRVSEAKELAKRAVDSAPGAFGTTHLHVRKYTAFLKQVEAGKPVTMPEVKFSEQFVHNAALQALE